MISDFQNEALDVLWAPVSGIQQLVAISGWREEAFHCMSVKRKSGFFSADEIQ